MIPPEHTARAISVVSEQIEALNEVLNRAKATGDTRLGFEQLKRWKEYTVELLRENVSESESLGLSSKRVGSFMMGQPMRNLLTEGKMYSAFMLALLDELQKNPERVLRRNAPEGNVAVVPIPEPTASRTVFLIHGHDELNLLRLSKLLKDRWKLDSIVLKDKPGKGRTLIQKFEEEAPAASFAIALLSPDDVVQGTGSEYPQARPNVVFELGWFYGRLGRDRVCILLRAKTKIHSDLDGISRIDFVELKFLPLASSRSATAAWLISFGVSTDSQIIHNSPWRTFVNSQSCCRGIGTKVRRSFVLELCGSLRPILRMRLSNYFVNGYLPGGRVTETCT